MEKNKKIGIIGVGVVGGALRKYFVKKNTKLFLYDKGKNIGSIDEVNKADIIFICVPTPFLDKKGFDLSYVEEACKGLLGKKIVVIKSTVVPGTTESFQKKYPNHKFLFNPEFLREVSPNKDMVNPDRQIVGYTKKSKNDAKIVLKMLPSARFKKIMKATEAEMVKYFSNNFLTIKVIFAEQMYDVCKKVGIDYKTVAEAASADPRIGKSHLQVSHGGYRGYSGKCFPKDIKAFIQFADSIGIDLKIHKVTEEINNILLKSNKD